MFDRGLRSLSLAFVLGNFISAIAIGPALAETELLKTLTVTGTGTEEISSTLAQVRLGVEFKAKTLPEVQSEIAKRGTKIVKLLQSAGVEQLKTDAVEVRTYSNYNESEKGFVGTNIVSFVVDIDKVSSLLNQSIEAGASRIDRVSFTATPEAIAKAKKEALRKATINAQDKAEVVLDTVNSSAEQIINIQLDGATINRPIRRQIRFNIETENEDAVKLDSARLEKSGTFVPVIAGENAVSASVTLEISY